MSLTMNGSLQSAVSMGSVELVRMVLGQEGIDLSRDSGRSRWRWGGDTPLHQATKMGNKEIAKLLIDAGIDVDARNLSGKTAFHIAVTEGLPEMTQLLLDHGADANLPLNGLTPLMLAVQNKSDAHLQTIRQFIHRCDIHCSDLSLENALHKAIWVEYVDFVEELLAAGAEINAQNANGTTPLMCAASVGSMDIVRLLLENGADVNMQNKERRNALHYAASAVFDDSAAKLLIEAGADINSQDRNGQTPLHIAAHHCHVKMARLLILSNCNTCVHDNDFQTPLDISIAVNSFKITYMLLVSGCDISQHQIDLIYSYNTEHCSNLGLQKSLLLLMTYLDEAADHPGTLLELSRKCIRRHLGSCITDKDIRHKISIPSNLWSFILLEELNEINY